MNKAIFLDRDGVINIDKSYVHKIEDFEFFKGVFETLKHLNKLGYFLIIVTNQSGIGRGYYTQNDFDVLTSHMVEVLEKKGALIKDVFHCPHLPDAGCECRKPSPGMLKEAIKKHNIDTSLSWMIGDKLSDVKAGKKVGIENTIYVNSSTCKEAKYSVQEILDIIPLIQE